MYDAGTRTLRIPRVWGTWILLGIPTAILLLVAGWSAWGLVLQEWRLRTYVPVAAVVTGSDVVNQGTLRAGHDSRVWEPIVYYRYPADAPVYAATRVTPIRAYGTRDWAVGLTMRYPPGQVVTAYHHPRRRGSAFLVREPQYRLVGYLLVPLAILFAGTYVRRRTR